MNRARWFPLGIRFTLAFLLAVSIPAVTLALLSLESSDRLNQQSLEAFVRESGTYRTYLIADNFAQVQKYSDELFADPAAAGQIALNADRLRQPTLREETRRQLMQVMTDLLGAALFKDQNRLIESAWLLDPNGVVLVTAVNGNRRLPFNPLLPQEETSNSFVVGRNLAVTDEAQAFVVATRNGTPNFEIVRVIRNAARNVAGYLVIDLDITQVVLNELTAEDADFPSYTFMVLPDGVSSLQLLDVRRRQVADVNSIAVGRALAGQSSDVITYAVGGPNPRTVIGYYSSINVLGTRLALVSEIDQRIATTQRADYFSQRGFALFIGLAGLVITLSLLMTQVIVPPVRRLGEAMNALTRGNYDVPIVFAERSDELGTLGRDFVDMRLQVQRLVQTMQTRLEERSRNVRLTQEISRTALAERDLEVLLNKIVILISDNFSNIYHAQIFLVDSVSEVAVLRASTGLVGQELLKRGHRLEVGGASVIGQTTDQGQMILVRDTSVSNLHRPNDLLSETQAELAIPLVSATRVIGALDVQSKLRDSFTEDQIVALQTLAEQVTIAIENARLYEQSQRLLKTIDLESRDRTRRAWQNVFNAQRTSILTSRYGNETGSDRDALREAVLQSKQTIIGAKTDRGTLPVGIPLTVRGQLLGMVEFEVREADFSYNKILLAEKLMLPLGSSLDNARLFQDSVQTAEREYLVNTIGTQLTSQSDIESIVQTAIREVSTALGTPHIAIRFQAGTPTNGSSATNGHYTAPVPALPTSIASEESQT